MSHTGEVGPDDRQPAAKAPDAFRTISEVAEELDLPQANVSQHLAIMRERGLVRARKDGQFVFYSLTTMKIVEAVDLLRQVMAMRYEDSSA